MRYSISKLAKAAGISVRTLHYYDQIGLLHPSVVKDNGYRSYQGADLLRLQQILFFKELDFSLDQIKEIMTNPTFNIDQAFKDQRRLLEMKRARIEKLIETIDKRDTRGGDSMTTDDLYGNFTKDEMERYKDEAKKRWGHTDAYRQSEQRTKDWTKEDYKRVFDESSAIYNSLAALLKEGYEASSQETQEQIGKFYAHLKHFYEPSPEMFKGLGEMYTADARFKAFFDKIDPNLAEYMKEGMAIFAENKKGK